jgi:hypothetical protein
MSELCMMAEHNDRQMTMRLKSAAAKLENPEAMIMTDLLVLKIKFKIARHLRRRVSIPVPVLMDACPRSRITNNTHGTTRLCRNTLQQSTLIHISLSILCMLICLSPSHYTVHYLFLLQFHAPSNVHRSLDFIHFLLLSPS